jgi:Zn-finger nucleic acid-binding protein
MRQYERSGIHVDQCTECRGIFLDRGELEGMVESELRWASPSSPPIPPAPAQAPVAPAQHGYQQPYPPQPQAYPPQQQYGRPPKKRKSFLEDLFD